MKKSFITSGPGLQLKKVNVTRKYHNHISKTRLDAPIGKETRTQAGSNVHTVN